MSDLTISVIIATRDAERYLEGTLRSVAAQTLPPNEIVIVDGSSTDGTEAIARSFALVRFVAQEGQGLTEAWNQGIAASSGDLVAPLDSDDLWAPEKLARQTAFLAAHPEVECVASRLTFFLEPGEALPPGFRPELLEGSHPGWVPGNLLIRRSLFDRIGLFDPRLEIAADVDWVVRMRERGARVGMVGEVLLHKRVHAGNLSLGPLSAARMNREILDLLRRSIHERRARAPRGEDPGSGAP
jgi:glycosyltransferase involved in cell wall biosynthesis